MTDNPYDQCIANKIINGNSVSLCGMWMIKNLACG